MQQHPHKKVRVAYEGARRHINTRGVKELGEVDAGRDAGAGQRSYLLGWALGGTEVLSHMEFYISTWLTEKLVHLQY